VGEGVLTAGFSRVEGALACEGVPLERIAREVGTPAYVYSAAAVRDRYEQLERMLSATGAPHHVHYTLKANANLTLLRLLRGLGAGAEVVSGGELHRALHAGFPREHIVFGGVGKTDDELREAIAARVMMINVESEGELRRIDELSAQQGHRTPIGIRVNPGVALHAAHDYIKTGEKAHKFGIELEDAARVGTLAASLANVKIGRAHV